MQREHTIIELPEPKFSETDFPGASTVKIAKGAPFMFEGSEHVNDCYLILSGSMSVKLISSSGHETLLYHLSEGDLVGELASFGMHARTATVMAQTDCRLLRISIKSFSERMKDVDFQSRISAHFLKRYMGSHEVICRLGQPTVAMSLCRHLLSLPGWKSCEDVVMQVQLPSHMELSHMLSCQRESVTRAAKKLQKYGILVPMSDKYYTVNREIAEVYMNDE